MSQNKQCAYCHTILFDDDDIVCCPECGAPHHRDCYDKLGRCARQEFHGTAAAEPQEDSSRPSGIPRDREGRICEKCGNMSSSDTLFCPYCGVSFNQADEPKSTPPMRPPFVVPGVDPYGGVDPASDIEGVPASEMAIYVRANSHQYLPKFDRMAKSKKKVGWNWSAFVFSYGWLFYRKSYFAGLVAILFTIVSYIMISPYCCTVLRVVDELGVTDPTRLTQAQNDAIISETLARMEPFGWIMLAAGIVLMITIHVIVGMFGNRIYLERSKSKIGQIKADDRFDDKIAAITAAGGANIFSAAIILYFMINVVFSNVIFLFY